MKIQSDFLARMFHWSDEVIDAAQSPAAKLASTLLPIFAPLVPAFITAIKLHALYTQLIAGRFPDWVATFGAVMTAIVLEFLGWVGTIALVRNLYKWVKTRVDEYLVPTGLSGFAYIIYLADMWLVNSPKTNPDNIILLLALFSVPAGFLFAVTLVTGEDSKEEKEIRHEKRDERLQKYAIKHGKPVMVTNEQSVPQVKEKHAGDYKDYVMELLQKNGELPLTEITQLVNKNKRTNFVHKNVKGTWYKFVQEWKRR